MQYIVKTTNRSKWKNQCLLYVHVIFLSAFLFNTLQVFYFLSINNKAVFFYGLPKIVSDNSCPSFNKVLKV